MNDENPARRYTGLTDNLEARLKSHNQGSNPHTSKYRPWRIETAIAFSDRQRAVGFEEYLKSPSGRAFSKKGLWRAPFFVYIANFRAASIV
jgi:predicted GIY-YIG superfamily endonuclease